MKDAAECFHTAPLSLKLYLMDTQYLSLNKRLLISIYEMKYGISAEHQDYDRLATALCLNKRIKHITHDEIQKVKNMNTQTQQPLTDNSPMPFGKYRGKPMIDVPAKYLLWLFNEGCNDERVSKYINENLDALKKEAGER